MRRIVGTLVLLMSLFPGSQAAQAQSCTGDRIGEPGDTPTLEDFLSGNLACGTEAGGGDRWQEEHRPGGDLFERARGPNDPVDPSRLVGTWRTESETGGNELVCYDYGGSEFCFRLYDNGGGNVTYCTVGDVVVATARLVPNASGANPCGFL